jgi:hypothetical protein
VRVRVLRIETEEQRIGLSSRGIQQLEVPAEEEMPPAEPVPAAAEETVAPAETEGTEPGT